MIELLQQLGDGFIQFRQREEFSMAQDSDDPGLSDQNCVFDLGLISWFVGPRAGLLKIDVKSRFVIDMASR